jgi:quercetin dioxygenase-like cupin family protein
MYVVHHAHLICRQEIGEQQLAAVDASRGIRAFQAWVVTLAAGAGSPPRCHDGELALVVLSGHGKLRVAGGPQRFAAPCTLVIPPACEFELVNDASASMQMVAIFTRAPSAVG